VYHVDSMWNTFTFIVQIQWIIRNFRRFIFIYITLTQREIHSHSSYKFNKSYEISGVSFSFTSHWLNVKYIHIHRTNSLNHIKFQAFHFHLHHIDSMWNKFTFIVHFQISCVSCTSHWLHAKYVHIHRTNSTNHMRIHTISCVHISHWLTWYTITFILQIQRIIRDFIRFISVSLWLVCFCAMITRHFFFQLHLQAKILSILST